MTWPAELYQHFCITEALPDWRSHLRRFDRKGGGSGAFVCFNLLGNLEEKSWYTASVHVFFLMFSVRLEV